FHQRNLFASITGIRSWRELQTVFSVKPSAYWLHHYRFFKKQEKEVASLGRASIENTLINTIAPILMAYGKSRDDDDWTMQARRLLHATASEDNHTIRAWDTWGGTGRCAFDSQALSESYNSIC